MGDARACHLKHVRLLAGKRKLKLNNTRPYSMWVGRWVSVWALPGDVNLELWSWTSCLCHLLCYYWMGTEDAGPLNLLLSSSSLLFGHHLRSWKVSVWCHWSCAPRREPLSWRLMIFSSWSKKCTLKKIGKNTKKKFVKAIYIHRCAHHQPHCCFCASKFEIWYPVGESCSW